MKEPNKTGSKVIATAGTAEQAAQAAGGDAVVIGPATGPITPGGPGVGAAQTAQKAPGLVAELTDLAAAEMSLRGPLTLAERRAIETLEARDRRLRGRKAGVAIDAKDVPGRRLAEAVTTIKHDGNQYSPAGDPFVPVDFKAYVQLRQIGAIVDTPWDDLSRIEAEPTGESAEV